MKGFDADIPGTGTVPIAPGILAGVLAIAPRDFGDGLTVPAACLVIDHPEATPRMEWLRAGSVVRAGDGRWTVESIQGDSRAGGRVSLRFMQDG